jgi:hypothetical protein
MRYLHTTLLLTLLAAAAGFQMPAFPQITATGSGSQSVTLSSPTPILCSSGTTQLICVAAVSPTVTLPIEICWPAGTVVSSTVTVPAGAPVAGAVLWLQIHGLRYDTEASVQVNNSVWLPLSAATVKLQGNASIWGGIGGGFATLSMTVPLPAGVVVAGANTVRFRFNGTDGISSGFRVLAFNLRVGGVDLIPATVFTEENPAAWTPPLNDPTDIAAGLALWQTGALTDPASGATIPITAHCSDCHTVTGRDLKYFNYSNLSIEARSMFHGLTAQQGKQVASYIRSLTTPSPGRPWNPPYQPGPGLDSQPVANWSAGAGLAAVLATDADELNYLMPGGSTTKLLPGAWLNQRETPIALQLQDWNHWLPTIHPRDAFGATFTNSLLFTGYGAVRAELAPSNPANYQQFYLDIGMKWLNNQTSFLAAVVEPQSNTAAWANPAYDQQVNSVGLWMMVKSWEINQDFGLEGEARSVFGANAPSARAWYSNQSFLSSPFFLKMPSTNAPGIGNGSYVSFEYSSFIWYQTPLILNDGNGLAQGTTPIDWGYTIAYLVGTLAWNAGPQGPNLPRTGTAGLLFEWLAKALQGAGVGIAPSNTSPYFLVAFPAELADDDVDEYLAGICSDPDAGAVVHRALGRYSHGGHGFQFPGAG